MATLKHEAVAGKVYIWAETANINHFVSTPLTPVSYGSVTNGNSTVKSHTRRQYPGDASLVNVSGHSRVFIKDPGRKYGNSLPGKSFIIDDGTEKRQMTYQGDFVDLHSYFVTATKAAISLYSERGVRYSIAAPNP